MDKITAKGKYQGKTMVVAVERLEENYYKWTFNGAQNFDLQVEAEMKLARNPSMGGTFYPKSMDMKLVALFEGKFFDRGADSIKIEGNLDEKMPSEKGVIY